MVLASHTSIAGLLCYSLLHMLQERIYCKICYNGHLSSRVFKLRQVTKTVTMMNVYFFQILIKDLGLAHIMIEDNCSHQISINDNDLPYCKYSFYHI